MKAQMVKMKILYLDNQEGIWALKENEQEIEVFASNNRRIQIEKKNSERQWK